MEIRRTAIVKLDVSDDAADRLLDTVDELRWAANYVVDAACDGDWIETNKSVLQDLTYGEVREQTSLHSNHVQSARDRASDALKSTISKWKDGESASIPTFTADFVEYNKRNATFYDDHATLSTVDGRVTVEYIIPNENRDTPHSTYLDSDEWEQTGATLHYRDGSFYLHVRTKATVDEPDPGENGTVLGVDLGIENVAVTSTGAFWSGDELNHWHQEYVERRRSLHQCGSRYAHENVQSVGRKETGRVENYLHSISNELVSEAVEHGCTHIAFEELTGIRSRMAHARKFHEWAFRRLYEYVEYKAVERGIVVSKVPPAYTSQRCSTCGFTHENNRSEESFECQKCGYANHSDYNAAKNIELRYLRHRQNGGGGGAPVGVRLNTCMVNTNGILPVPILG